jgi:hypothetical protein
LCAICYTCAGTLDDLKENYVNAGHHNKRRKVEGTADARNSKAAGEHDPGVGGDA